jgi:hypothetical protein
VPGVDGLADRHGWWAVLGQAEAVVEAAQPGPWLGPAGTTSTTVSVGRGSGRTWTDPTPGSAWIRRT